MSWMANFLAPARYVFSSSSFLVKPGGSSYPFPNSEKFVGVLSPFLKTTRSGPAVSKRCPLWVISAPLVCFSYTIGLSPSLTEKRNVCPECFLAFPCKEYWIFVNPPKTLPWCFDFIIVRVGPFASTFVWNSFPPKPSLDPLYKSSNYLFYPIIIVNSICF